MNELSFTVEPGTVTGFLGPNGAGKTTTLRCLLGLISPSDGTATIGGSRYAELAAPTHTVGAMLEASSFHPRRTGRDHLRVYCRAAGIAHSRADEVLELVGLAAAAGRKAGQYSLGMRQRLGLAAALLGDPPVLILDEPANGLDPEGIAWMRQLLRQLAEQGRTVLVSSHLLREMQQIADDVVIINRGRLVKQGQLAELAREHRHAVRVSSPEAERLANALDAHAAVERLDGERLRVTGVDTATVGHLAFTNGVELHELTAEASDLEQIFFTLTENEAGDTGTGTGDAEPAPSQAGGQP
ncbi:ABC transporter ATP-binding protein [Haloechinothrix sp. LS1_15]|uniref:ABC transporter ATP-binding protein n=1 Tax=Haloechinothrix sp. LS1_15 TaxID=2652248 RepID=UPI00294AFCE4|nr:ABC transporter ATP-binding protein [Haloechinothrix sp. LS1_15]